VRALGLTRVDEVPFDEVPFSDPPEKRRLLSVEQKRPKARAVAMLNSVGEGGVRHTLTVSSWEPEAAC
jgi:hypothetical protein